MARAAALAGSGSPPQAGQQVLNEHQSQSRPGFGRKSSRSQARSTALQMAPTRRCSPVIDWSDNLDEQHSKTETQELLAKSLDQLKPVDKAVIVLSDLEGLSDREIADATGLTVSAVKTRLHRARLFLRGKLAVQLGYSAA